MADGRAGARPLMRCAIDTSIVPYHRRRNGAVVPRLQAVPPRRLAIPPGVVFGVPLGLLRSGRASALAAFDDRVAACMPIGRADLKIAATARRQGCMPVTRCAREDSRVPGRLIEDWH